MLDLGRAPFSWNIMTHRVSLRNGNGMCGRDVESGKLGVLPAELELVRVQDDASLGKRVEEPDGAPPVGLEVIVPEYGVVDATFFVREVSDGTKLHTVERRKYG